MSNPIIEIFTFENGLGETRKYQTTTKSPTKKLQIVKRRKNTSSGSSSSRESKYEQTVFGEMTQAYLQNDNASTGQQQTQKGSTYIPVDVTIWRLLTLSMRNSNPFILGDFEVVKVKTSWSILVDENYCVGVCACQQKPNWNIFLELDERHRVTETKNPRKSLCLSACLREYCIAMHRDITTLGKCMVEHFLRRKWGGINSKKMLADT